MAMLEAGGVTTTLLVDQINDFAKIGSLLTDIPTCHRFHWYIIVEHNKAKLNQLTNRPIDLFKLCGSPATVNGNFNPSNSATVWDQINLWVLAQMVDARANMAGASQAMIDNDYRHFQQHHVD